MEKNQFHKKLRELMNQYVHLVFNVTEFFPKGELYGLTSQYRRASLSIILNYIEGFARCSKNVMKNFFEISYGSLKESRYLTEFSKERKLLKQTDFNKLIKLVDEIGAMLWTVISKMN